MKLVITTNTGGRRSPRTASSTATSRTTTSRSAGRSPNFGVVETGLTRSVLIGYVMWTAGAADFRGERRDDRASRPSLQVA